MVYVVLKKKRFERFTVNEFVNAWDTEDGANQEVERLNAEGFDAFYVTEPIQCA